MTYISVIKVTYKVNFLLLYTLYWSKHTECIYIGFSPVFIEYSATTPNSSPFSEVAQLVKNCSFFMEPVFTTIFRTVRHWMLSPTI
jgi:hypothetical protein